MPKPQLKAPSRPFFDDPTIDRLIEIIIGLSANLSSLEERFELLTAHLDATGIATCAALDDLRKDPAVIARLERRQRETITMIVEALG